MWSAHTCNITTSVGETGTERVQGQPRLHDELKVRWTGQLAPCQSETRHHAERICSICAVALPLKLGPEVGAVMGYFVLLSLGLVAAGGVGCF